jgi:peptidoglycan/LPS O-acetylase OafA/YrhL
MLLAGMVAVAIAWTLTTRSIGVPDVRVTGLWLPAFLDWFALGMGLAVVRAWHDLSGRFTVLDQLGDAAGTCWAVAALLFWLTATPLGGPRGLQLPTTGQALTKHLLYGGAALFLLLPAVFGSDGRSVVRRVLEHPVARWLGGISYGVFVWHLLVLDLVVHAAGLAPFTGHLPLVAVLVLPLSVLVAWLSLRLVERPALDRKRRWAATR